MKYSNIRVEYQLSILNDDGMEIIGDYIWDLLRLLKKVGSIKAAADKVEKSYRKVWGDLKEIEDTLGFPLVIKSRGGESGGSTYLSEEGEKLLAAYSALNDEISVSVNDYIIAFKRTLKKD